MDPKRDLILVVDDEPAILRMATTALSNAGFRAVVAENGLAGLELFRTGAQEISLVLTDIVMPVMNGLEMATRILELDAGARILLMSGYSDAVLQAEGENRFPLIRKPYLPTDLITRIQALIGNSV